MECDEVVSEILPLRSKRTPPCFLKSFFERSPGEARNLSALRRNPERCHLSRGGPGVQPSALAEKLSGPWAVHCLECKVIVIKYLHTRKLSGSSFQTALGCHVTLCPPKPRVKWMQPPESPLVVMDKAGGRITHHCHLGVECDTHTHLNRITENILPLLCLFSSLYSLNKV